MLTINAIDPDKGKTYGALISYNRMQVIGKRSMGQAKECAELVPMILQRPVGIFEGLCEDKDEEGCRGYGWRCYCGIPDYAYNRKGEKISPWPNEVFLVFIDNNRVVYNWRWEKSAPQNPNLPENYETRFRRKLL